MNSFGKKFQTTNRRKEYKHRKNFEAPSKATLQRWIEVGHLEVVGEICYNALSFGVKNRNF